jgi:long-chain fatty acid transport protein
MDAGWFPPPHAYVAAPIMKDLVFGFGTYCEYGLGTKYDNDWDLRGDTTETTIEQFTFNPNIAYKITEDWSVAFGARMSYITFENYKTPLSTGNVMINHPIFGVIPTGQGGYIRTHLKGDDFNCGYMLATQYKVTDDLNLGLVYRSRINHRIEGELDCSHSGLGSAVAPKDGDAEAKLVLPASVTLGANYDITEKLQSGVSLTWTEWSTIDHIDFNLPKKMDGSDASYEETLSWNDAWRIGFGFEYQFTDAFSGAVGYTYDLDPSHKRYGTTMLPSGDRHIIGTGIGYKFFDNWRIDLGYSFIIMESRTRIMEAMDANTGLERDDFKLQTNNSYSHIVSATVSYTF